MTDEVTQFDPIKYKETTREQWQTAAEPWYRWGPTIEEWLGQATETMLDMAEVGSGRRVLDVAAGAGGQTIAAARRIGPTGYILATDISSNILEFASEAARQEGLLGKVETRVMDGESLQELEQESFDAVISRLGLSYFPDQQKALTGAWRTLKPGGGSRPLSTRHLRTTSSSPSRFRSSANVPNFRAVARTARAIQSRRGRRPRRGVPTGRFPRSGDAHRSLTATPVLRRRVCSLRARVVRGASPDDVRAVSAGARISLGGDRERATPVRGTERVRGALRVADRSGH
jgi:SAM-dependent methyltransferase